MPKPPAMANISAVTAAATLKQQTAKLISPTTARQSKERGSHDKGCRKLIHRSRNVVGSGVSGFTASGFSSLKLIFLGLGPDELLFGTIVIPCSFDSAAEIIAGTPAAFRAALWDAEDRGLMFSVAESRGLAAPPCGPGEQLGFRMPLSLDRGGAKSLGCFAAS